MLGFMRWNTLEGWSQGTLQRSHHARDLIQEIYCSGKQKAISEQGYEKEAETDRAREQGRDIRRTRGPFKGYACWQLLWLLVLSC